MTCCTADRTLEVGTAIRLEAELSEEGVRVDPATVTLRMKSPTGATSTPITVEDAPGLFHCDLQLNTPGQWWYRWESTMPIAAEEGSFVVRKSSVL